jgi:hypothetical protein
MSDPLKRAGSLLLVVMLVVAPATGTVAADPEPIEPTCTADEPKQCQEGETPGSGTAGSPNGGTVGTAATTAERNPRSISVGESIAGELDTNDPQSPDRRGYHEPLTFAGTAGETVTVDMRSNADAYVQLVAPNGTVVAEDDDSGMGLDPILTHTLATDGTYTVVATSNDPTATFAYTLSLYAGAGSIAATTVDVPDQVTAGEFYGATATVENGGGAPIVADVLHNFGGIPQSTDVVRVLRDVGRQVRLSGDAAGYPAANVPADLVLRDGSGENRGTETRTVEVTGDPLIDLRSTTLGSRATGQVDVQDPFVDVGDLSGVGRHETVRVDLTAGQTAVFAATQARSTGVELYLVAPDGSVVANGNGGSAAKLIHTPATTGEYRLVVAGGIFEYTLTAETAQRTADLRSIAPGETRVGQLDGSDPTGDAGPVEPVEVELTSGQPVSVVARSNGNMIVEVVAPDGSTVLERDGSGTDGDATLTFTPSQTGNYTLRVSDTAGAPSDYVLSVTDGAPDVSVTNVGTPTAVTPGGPFTVAVELSNNGSAADGVRLEYFLAGTELDDTQVWLEPGETTTVRLVGRADGLIDGDYQSVVRLSDGEFNLQTESDVTGTLTVENATPADVREVTVGDARVGDVDAGDPFDAALGGAHEPVTVALTANETVAFDASGANEFLRLRLLAPDGTIVASANSTAHAQVVHTANETGNYTLAVSVGDDRTYAEYLLETTQLANVTTDPNPFDSPVPGTGATALPTDPDGDGQFEDVDGDGTFRFLDVVALLFADYEAINADPDTRQALNFDETGNVGFLDVVELLFQL